jgi:hypothetical protein
VTRFPREYCHFGRIGTYCPTVTTRLLSPSGVSFVLTYLSDPSPRVLDSRGCTSSSDSEEVGRER